MSVSLLILAKALSFIALALLIGSAITRLYLLKDEKQIAIKGLKFKIRLFLLAILLGLLPFCTLTRLIINNTTINSTYRSGFIS